MVTNYNIPICIEEFSEQRNINRIREAIVDFTHTEFYNCCCYDMTVERAKKIVIQFYYNKLQINPLPPHNVSVGDLLSRAFKDLM